MSTSNTTTKGQSHPSQRRYPAELRERAVRMVREATAEVEISRVHKDNFGVYGTEKIWRQLNREGVRVGRNRVARLMRELGLEGVVRGQRKWRSGAR